MSVSKKEGIRGVYKGLGVNLVLVMPEKAIKLAVNDQLRSSMGGRGTILPIYKELFAGTMAGACQVVVTTPMELLKIKMQVWSKHVNMDAETKKASAARMALNMLKEGGIKSMYRGLQATLLRDVSFSAIYFPLLTYLNVKGIKGERTKPPLYHTLASGFAAGSVAAFSVTPFDVIKTRIQAMSPESGKVQDCSIKDCAIKTYKNDGLRAFFRGSLARVSVIAPLFGIAQTVYFLGITERLMKMVS